MSLEYYRFANINHITLLTIEETRRKIKGVSVASPIAGKDELKSCSIPAGMFVFAMYQGAYAQMKDAYDEMGKFIADNNLEPSGIAYEIHYNGQDVTPDKLLTKIEFALK